MGSFPMSVANNFCDKLLSKYLDSKTVLIYCPHPVYMWLNVTVFTHTVSLIAISELTFSDLQQYLDF